jgi:hypothetical protein
MTPCVNERKAAIYRTYLLRLWQPDASGTGGWRVSLEDPRTGERVGFAGLEELFDFLMQRVEHMSACAAQRAAQQRNTEEP